MFFIGLETASIPMATLVAFDKYNHKSAEAGAKIYPVGSICIQHFTFRDVNDLRINRDALFY